MSTDAASNSTGMTIGTVGNATGSSVGAARGRDRNTLTTGTFQPVTSRSHRFATARHTGRGHGPLLQGNRPLV